MQQCRLRCSQKADASRPRDYALSRSDRAKLNPHNKLSRHFSRTPQASFENRLGSAAYRDGGDAIPPSPPRAKIRSRRGTLGPRLVPCLSAVRDFVSLNITSVTRSRQDSRKSLAGSSVTMHFILFSKGSTLSQLRISSTPSKSEQDRPRDTGPPGSDSSYATR